MKKLTLVLLFTLSLIACENSSFRGREKGAIAGAGLGAGLGAIVGNQVGSAGAGVAIGSAFGALSGGIIGNEIDGQNDVIDQRNRKIEDQDRLIAENKRLLEELRMKGIDAQITERGVLVNLPDVLFEFDSARLTAGARRTVSEIASSVGKGSGRIISVEGHTDSIGSDAYNNRLSESRAFAVASGLERSGISRSGLRVRGFGKSKPIASNSTENGRQRNRRVEVIIGQ